MKQEVKDVKGKYESTNLEANNRDREIEQAKNMAFKTQEEAEKQMEEHKRLLDRTKQENEDFKKK